MTSVAYFDFMHSFLRRKTFLANLLLFLLVFTIGTTFAHAQSGVVTGHITDSSGAAVANGAIEIQNTATGLKWSTTTNSAGIYLFPPLEPGTYTLHATAPNFSMATVTNIQLEVVATQTADVALQPATTNETVMVTASAPELNADQPD